MKCINKLIILKQRIKNDRKKLLFLSFWSLLNFTLLRSRRLFCWCLFWHRLFWNLRSRFLRRIWFRLVDDDFSQYDLVVAPVLYMIKSGLAEKIDQYVKKGGNFVASYLS
ncbi:beta-galactosidase trimerization domain-containing protein, partial [Dubosiella newyorkensis]|uniref:beta-galactosidase trimerization domain-containing protein n=1 Tax=Dubosiella newyorkensis TaxID=1862672 RepID=UPI0034E51462